MRADMGTKALPEHPFCPHRDVMNGYALVRTAYPEKKLPGYVVVGNSMNEQKSMAKLTAAIMAVPFLHCEQL